MHGGADNPFPFYLLQTSHAKNDEGTRNIGSSESFFDEGGYSESLTRTSFLEVVRLGGFDAFVRSVHCLRLKGLATHMDNLFMITKGKISCACQ